MLLLDNSTEVRFGPYGLAYPALASQLEAFGLTQDNYVWRKVCFTSVVTMFFALSAPSDTCRLYLVVSRGISWYLVVRRGKESRATQPRRAMCMAPAFTIIARVCITVAHRA